MRGGTRDGSRSAASVGPITRSGLSRSAGEEPIVYLLGPLAADGLMVMATGALLATAPHRTINRLDRPTRRRAGDADTPNRQAVQWPDVLDRTRSLVDDALGGRETAATPAGSRA